MVIVQRSKSAKLVIPTPAGVLSLKKIGYIKVTIGYKKGYKIGYKPPKASDTNGSRAYKS